MRSIKEFLKDLLIMALVLAILILSLLALPSKTITQSPLLATILRPFSQWFGISRAELAKVQTSSRGTAAAQPIAISVNNTAGRTSYLHDFALLDAQYDALGGFLAKALSSAQNEQKSDRAALYGALSSPSAAFFYHGNIPVPVLAAWLGCETKISLSANLFVLCENGSTLDLYLMADEISVYQTDVPSSALDEAVGAAVPDGSRFCYETDQKLDGLCLLCDGMPPIFACKAQNPCDSRFAGTLAEILGFNPYGESSYTDSAGNVNFSEANCLLKIGSDGTVRLENSDPSRFLTGAGDDASQVEAARALLSSIFSAAESDARLYLSSYEKTPQGAVCCFDYVLGGTPVLCRSHAATVTLDGKKVVSVNLWLRKYLLQSELLPVLPPQQATIIAPDGAREQVRYADNGAAELYAGWTEA